MLAARLADAEMTGPATATGNYSYRADRMCGAGLHHGRRCILVHRSGVLVRRLPRDEKRLPGRRRRHRLPAPIPGEAERALRHFDNEVRRALDRFSWFIYRINTPAIRELFMRPGNPLRMREAVLALLSGDAYGNSPIHFRLLLFKCVFYFKSFFSRRGIPPARAGAT